jgi:hypothetical protein
LAYHDDLAATWYVSRFMFLPMTGAITERNGAIVAPFRSRVNRRRGVRSDRAAAASPSPAMRDTCGGEDGELIPKTQNHVPIHCL